MSLHYAARSGHLDCARLLLERGAYKEAKNKVRAPTRATVLLRALLRSAARLVLLWSRPLLGEEPRRFGLRRARRVAAALSVFGRSKTRARNATRRVAARPGARRACIGHSVLCRRSARPCCTRRITAAARACGCLSWL